MINSKGLGSAIGTGCGGCLANEPAQRSTVAFFFSFVVIFVVLSAVGLASGTAMPRSRQIRARAPQSCVLASVPRRRRMLPIDCRPGPFSLT